MISQLLDTLATRLGFRPRTVPEWEEMLVLCDQQERATHWVQIFAYLVLVTQVLWILLLPPTLVANILAVIAVFIATTVLRGYLVANQTIRTTVQLATTLRTHIDYNERTINSYQEAIERLESAQSITLLNLEKMQVLQDTIDAIPEGWLWTMGIMNTSQRTGPMAFLWRSDVEIDKHGKVKTTAVTGEGDTIVAALRAAIDKALLKTG